MHSFSIYSNRMLLLLCLFGLEPAEVVNLPAEFSSVTYYRNTIYLAPHFGKSIFRFDQGEIEPLQFSELDDYRIRNFQLTPFAIYVNDGRKIEKLYLSTGTREIVYEAEDISSFAITAAEEAIVADRGKKELVFLDFRNIVKLKKENIDVVDFACGNGSVYCLTGREVLVLDEFSNVVETIKLKAVYDKIVLGGTGIFVFTPGKKSLHRPGAETPAVEFLQAIDGIAFGDSSMVVLTGNGTALYIYNKPGF